METNTKKRSKLDTFTTLVLLAICVFLAVLIGRDALEGAKGKQQNARRADAGSTTVNVSAITLEKTSFTRTASMGAELEDSLDAHNLYSSDVGGTLTAFTLVEGQTIKAGDVIGTVDPSTPGEVYKPTDIKASIGGTVYAVDGYVGERITTSTPLASVGSSGDLEVVANVAERYLSTIAVGMQASFTTSAWPNEPYTATIKSISPTVNTTNRTVKVTLSIDHPDARLKEGMYVSLVLTIERQEDVIVVPSTALGTYLGNPVVYVVEDGVAIRRPVTLGSANDTSTVITSGLAEGDVLVTAGSVTDHTTVSVVGD